MAEKKLAVPPKNQKRTDLDSFAGKSPEMVLERASMIAGPLSRFIEEKKLYAGIGDKKYVMAEGWSTMGVMLGVFPQVEWTRKMEGVAGELAWESRVVLKNTAGEVLGAGEAMASSQEKNPRGNRPVWASNEYSIRSMAQTRALGKAFRLSFSWLMTTAGYEPTPMEEMPFEDVRPTTTVEEPEAIEPEEDRPDMIKVVQVKVIEGLVARTQYKTVEAFEKVFGKSISSLTSTAANSLIEKLNQKIKEQEEQEEDESVQ